MITKRISDSSVHVIEQYKNIPYFNNRRTSVRAALPVEIGKGSPKEIHEEIEFLLKKNKQTR